MLEKPKRLKSKNLRDSSKGKPCTARIPGICNFNIDTTVGAHLGGAGMALKSHDIHLADLCSSCHSFIDGGYTQVPNMQPEKVELIHLRAVIETQERMIREGLIGEL